MTRKRKIVHEADGTPVETDEDIFTPPQPEKAPRSEEREVEITPAGAEAQCWSEHGMHDEAGVIIKTKYADIFVQRGWAKEVQ